jgi:hypothetical protein
MSCAKENLAIVLLSAMLLGASPPAGARALAAPIDDSGTATLEPLVGMRWQEVSPRRRASMLMQGRTTVRVRLNLQPWVGHSGRIYMVLPAQRPGPINVSWTTQGQLLPGQLNAGLRTLVYQGRITSPVLQDSLQMLLTVDGTQMRQNYTLSFRFEFDED